MELQKSHDFTMDSIHLGITTSFKPKQPSKTMSPISLNVDGKVMVLNEVQPKNASRPIDSTPSGLSLPINYCSTQKHYRQSFIFVVSMHWIAHLSG